MSDMSDYLPRLFEGGTALAEVPVNQPALCLVENDRYFGVFIAESVNRDPNPTHLHLLRALHFRVPPYSGPFVTYPRVDMAPCPPGVFVFRDAITGLMFREPSRLPYHLIFIDQRSYHRVLAMIAREEYAEAFRWCQEQYSQLPGFSLVDQSLRSPQQYADAGAAISEGQWVGSKDL